MLSEKQLEAIEIAVGSKDGNTDVSSAIQGAAAAAAVAPIADPSTATAEDCANKINEILAALQG